MAGRDEIATLPGWVSTSSWIIGIHLLGRSPPRKLLAQTIDAWKFPHKLSEKYNFSVNWCLILAFTASVRRGYSPGSS